MRGSSPSLVLLGSRRTLSLVSYLAAETSPRGRSHVPVPPNELTASLQRPTARLRKRWSSTPVKWSPIPLSLGAAVLVALSFYKQQQATSSSDGRAVPENQIKVQGPWQVSCALFLYCTECS